jgi:DNA repair exonuclease SbcCD ATPase subunit
MKEGYIQLKISELNDKLNKIDQMFSLEKSKIELLEEKVGGLKELVKKLKDLDSFKENILKEVQKENQNILSKEIKNISDKIPKSVGETIENKTKEIDIFLQKMKKYEEEMIKQEKLINSLNEKINYLSKHNEYLMMKLVNKAVLSDREITELDNRSAKK